MYIACITLAQMILFIQYLLGFGRYGNMLTEICSTLVNLINTDWERTYWFIESLPIINLIKEINYGTYDSTGDIRY